MTVKWSDRALADLVEVAEQIRHEALLDDIFQAIDRLELFPQLGHTIPGYDTQNAREVFAGHYRYVSNRGRHPRDRANSPWQTTVA